MKPPAAAIVIVSAPASLVTVTVLLLTTGGPTVALASLAANRTPTVASAAISASRLGRENIGIPPDRVHDRPVGDRGASKGRDVATWRSFPDGSGSCSAQP